MDNYNGDMVIIDRLIEFFPDTGIEWNSGEKVNLQNIDVAIINHQLEEPEPFGDTWEHLCMENKSTQWHIGRILYFINHPEEIKDIELDNYCDNGFIYPEPIIVDGNHRFMAALWLRKQCTMDKVHCRYGGREDILDYLTGRSDGYLMEVV